VQRVYFVNRAPVLKSLDSCTAAKPPELSVQQKNNKPDDIDVATMRTDALLYADGLFFLGVDVPRVLVPEKTNSVPSSAYWKMLEVRDRYRVDSVEAVLKTSSSTDRAPSSRSSIKESGAELEARSSASSTSYVARHYSNVDLAIDIGASPGGWSYCLSQNLGAKRVLAVDPAEHMHDLVKNIMTFNLKECPIEQWRLKGDQALDQLAADVIETPGSAKLSVFVCDMNEEPERPVELVRKLISLNLAREGKCLLVLTFKNTCKSKADYIQRQKACVCELEQMGVRNVEVVHLFANTAMEMTVVGELCG